jgi:DNA primase
MSFVDLNDSIIAQVRQAADIVEFVSQVTPMKPAGKSHKGLCPFHREKSPSFTVDRAKGLFHCFGCGVGGDVFKFLTLTERFTFPEAVEHVAGRVGIELPRKKKGAKENDRDQLLDALDDASLAFHQALKWTPNTADDYLTRRRVPRDVIEKYGFGYAPDSWDYIVSRLSGNHPPAKLESVGLIMPRKTGSGYRDRFHNRLMIPIHSETGAIVGFGGRSLDGSEPKYLNSPESEIFNKSRLLYNLHRSKDQMRKLDRAILVEGYFDAIAIDHAGVPGVVASMGTSLTTGQASMLRRYTRRVVIAYDGDGAGRNATLRAAPILLSSGMAVEVLDLGGEKDPDTLIQNHGLERFLELLGNPTDIFHFALAEWAGDSSQMTSRRKSELLDDFVPLLSAVSDPVLRNDAAQRIADALRLEFETIWSRVRGRSTAVRERQAVAPNATGEKTLLAAAIQGKLQKGQLEGIRDDYFEDPVNRTLFSIIKSDLLTGQPIDFGEVATHVRGESELTRLSELTLGDEVEDRTLQRIDQILRPMEKAYVERRISQIQQEIDEIHKAGTGGDRKRAQQLDVEKMHLLKQQLTLK